MRNMKVVWIFRSRDNKEKCKTSTQAWFCTQAFSGHEKIKHFGCCLELFSKEGRSSFLIPIDIVMTTWFDYIWKQLLDNSAFKGGLVCLFFRLIYFNVGLYTAPNVTLPEFAHHHNYHLHWQYIKHQRSVQNISIVLQFAVQCGNSNWKFDWKT